MRKMKRAPVWPEVLVLLLGVLLGRPGAAAPPGVSRMCGGGSHSLLLRPDGTLWATGTNRSYELGDGTTNDRSVFIPVPLPSQVVDMDCDRGGSVAVLADGGVWVWGPPFSVPTRVTALTGVVAVAVGGGKAVALKPDGTVWEWVYRLNNPMPVQVAGGLTFAYLKAGELFTCGITSQGTAYCWGDNEYGQLGDGTFTPSSVPVKVSFQP